MWRPRWFAEDCGGLERLADVRATFGDEIGDMVEELSDSTAEDAGMKPPWRDRKVAYLERLSAHAGSPATLVSLADKTQNAEAIVADLTDPLGTPGLGVFARFRASAMEVAWFYLELAAAFRAVPGMPRRLTDRLRAAALTIHDHAILIEVVPGTRREMAVGHAVWAGTWGVLPVETLEMWEVAVARFRNCRTVGDVREHPSLPHDRFADRLTWLGLVETYGDVDGDDPQSDAEELQVTPAEWLPDDLPLWVGWDLPIADEVEFPALPDVPWEEGWAAEYEGWAPDEVRALIVDGDDLTGPLQEVTRATLNVESIEELRSAAEAAGWQLIDEGGRYSDVAFGIERPRRRLGAEPRPAADARVAPGAAP